MHFFLSKDLKNLKAKYISSKAAPLRREKLYFQLIFQVIWKTAHIGQAHPQRPNV